MIINIDDQTKIRLAQKGANKLFNVEYEERQNMSENNLIDLFDQAWSRIIKHQIMKADLIPPEEVRRRLLDNCHPYIDPDQEHRSFHYDKAEFIVQLQLSQNSQYQLTQLWRVVSSDSHPTTLFVEFNSPEELKRFKFLAESLDTTGEELGLQLIYHFMSLHPNYKPD